MIFNIQRYSTHDGPGIRTVVFMKGCPLRCRWCQNPESRARQRQVLFDARRCLDGCTLCQQAAPQAIERTYKGLKIQRDKLDDRTLDRLTDCCPCQALSVCGEQLQVADILAIVVRDKPFYQRSGGGVTLSGGEPFMQPLLVQMLLRACRRQAIHTAVETCLHVPWRNIAPALPFIDLLLVDVKHIDDTLLRRWAGGSVKSVLDNLQRLAREGTQIIIRVPLIPGFNADRASIQAIIRFAAVQRHVQDIHFLPYHRLGIHKYRLLGETCTAPEKALDAPQLLAFALDFARQQGLTPTLRG